MKIKRWVGLVIGTLLWVGCVPEPEQPIDLIPRAQMVDMLIQIHLLEAKMNKVPKRTDDSVKYVFEHYQKFIFEDFDVDSAQYRRSITYYMDNPGEFIPVYQAVVDSLALRAKNKNFD